MPISIENVCHLNYADVFFFFHITHCYYVFYVHGLAIDTIGATHTERIL